MIILGFAQQGLALAGS